MTISLDAQIQTRRDMGHLESYYSRRGLTIRLAIVTNRVDVARLQHAFAALTASHEALRARVIERDGRRLFDISPKLTLPFTAGPGNPDAFVDELAAPLPVDRHLAALDVVSDDERSAVVLTVAHNIADVRGVAYLFLELWNAYLLDDVFSAHSVERLRDMPQSAEFWIDPADAPPMPAPLEGEFLAPASPMSGAKSIRRRLHFTLDADITTRLREVTRQRGTTVHGAIAGSVLAAEREMIDRPGKLPMALRSSVDLRPRLNPVVHPLEATPMLGQVMAQTFVGTDDAPLDIGHQVTDAIKDRIADRTALFSSVQPTDAYRPPISYVVNAGAFPELPVPVKSIRLGISRHVPYKAPTYAAYSYNGSLNLDSIAPTEGIEICDHQHLTDLIESNLCAIASTGRCA